MAIIGSGPAGYTAAIYAARANLAPVVFAGGPTEDDPQRVPGGQLMITNDVENYPGFPESVTGPELMDFFKRQAERFGTKVLMESVVKVDFSRRPFFLQGETHVKGEELFKNRGVSACATCDGFFFKGQDVIVVGGGDTAMEEATYLTKIVKHVSLVHRRDTLRASKIMQERAMKNPKISLVWNSVVDEILGDDKGMNAALIRNVKTGERSQLKASGLFVAIGHRPNSDLFKGVLEMNPNGYINTVPGTTRTSLPGVFACGDVQDHYYRQAVTAAGTGCMAAMDAERWMTEQGTA